MLAPLSSVRPSEAFCNSSSYCFGALAAIQALASARNAASCGVSSKFMFSILGRVSVRIHGWVELSDTHHCRRCCDGYRCAQPLLRASKSLSRIPLAHPVDQHVFPVRQTTERQRHRVGTPVIHVAVEFPGKTHAAVDLDVVLGAMLDRC